MAFLLFSCCFSFIPNFLIVFRCFPCPIGFPCVPVFLILLTLGLAALRDLTMFALSLVTKQVVTEFCMFLMHIYHRKSKCFQFYISWFCIIWSTDPPLKFRGRGPSLPNCRCRPWFVYKKVFLRYFAKMKSLQNGQPKAGFAIEWQELVCKIRPFCNTNFGIFTKKPFQTFCKTTGPFCRRFILVKQTPNSQLQ